MNREGTPTYAAFDDFRYVQRIAVVVRWFLLATFLFLVNYRTDVAGGVLLTLNAMGVLLALLNAYVHWQIWRGRPVTRVYVLALSGLDLAVITAGIAITTRFNNTFFVFYYPALLGISLMLPSRLIAVAILAMVVAVYTLMSIGLSPGVSFTDREERVLIVRIITMIAVVLAGNLITRIERKRRMEAVEAALESEAAAQEERSRIAREIHDGIAQSIYMLNLNLETCAELAEREDDSLRQRLKELVPLAKQTLLETRHYIYDLKPVLSGEHGLVEICQNQLKEFQTVSGIPGRLRVHGGPREITMGVGAGLYRILQEALANILKHAEAVGVTVELTFEQESVRLSVQDDGEGFSVEDVRVGYGLDNMRHRAEELGGSCKILSAPGDGTCVMLTLPTG